MASVVTWNTVSCTSCWCVKTRAPSYRSGRVSEWTPSHLMMVTMEDVLNSVEADIVIVDPDLPFGSRTSFTRVRSKPPLGSWLTFVPLNFDFNWAHIFASWYIFIIHYHIYVCIYMSIYIHTRVYIYTNYTKESVRHWFLVVVVSLNHRCTVNTTLHFCSRNWKYKISVPLLECYISKMFCLSD